MEQTIQHADSPDVAPRNRYQYEPLIAQDAVRILILEPADGFESPLRCSIIQHRHSDDILNIDGCGYSAVSYTWGDPRPSHDLSVRLHPDAQAWALLRITATVDSMLRYFRTAQTAMFLWIDAICLSQEDETEKTKQIPLMGRIYSEAEGVNIWLGQEESDQAQRAFSIVRRVNRDRRLKVDDEEQLCLARLFNRPWFTRRWIVQEVVFSHAAIFHSGPYTLSLSQVMAFLEKAKSARTLNLLGHGSQMLLTIIPSHQTRKKDLLSNMWDLHESECSDKRDRIQAVYALASGPQWPLRQYEQSRWAEMYTDVATHYINNKSSFDVLLHLCDFGSIHTVNDKGAPSWVPNWTNYRQGLFLPLEVEWEGTPVKGLDFSFQDFLPYWEALSTYGFSSDNKEKNFQQLRKRMERYSLAVNLEASGRRLRIDYHPFYFVRCGIADQVIDPYLSKDPWEAFVGSRKPEEQQCAESKSSHQRSKSSPRCVEDFSLYCLLVDELVRQESELSQLIGPIKGYFDELRASRIDGRDAPAPSDQQKRILRDCLCALSRQRRVLVRVQTITTYYWAIGPADLVLGDWLIPLAHYRVYNAPLLCVRPTVPYDGGEQTWYPTPGTDLGQCLQYIHGLASKLSGKAPVDCLHVTGKFIGPGVRGYRARDRRFHDHAEDFDFTEEICDSEAFGKIMIEAGQAAMKKGLPGPVVFDIF